MIETRINGKLKAVNRRRECGNIRSRGSNEIYKEERRAGRKKEAVLRLLRGESVDALSRELGVTIGQLESWKAIVVERMELLLKECTEEPLSEELEAAKKQIGELHMENELLRSKVAKKGVFYTGKW